MTPKGIPSFGVIPFDRPWIAVDQSTGAVYVSTTGHPQRYVAVSHDKARTWGRIQALDCDEMTPPDANHDVTCATYPQTGDGNIAAARASSRPHTPRAPPPPAPAPARCSKPAPMREPIGTDTSSLPAYRARRTSSLPPTRRTPAASRSCSCPGIRYRAVSQDFPRQGTSPKNPSRDDQRLGTHLVNADNAGQ